MRGRGGEIVEVAGRIGFCGVVGPVVCYCTG
jgi:hypothetical protein